MKKATCQSSNKSPNFYVRGSSGRLGKQIVATILSCYQFDFIDEGDSYGGSFTALRNQQNPSGRIFVFASGKVSPNSTKIECESEYISFSIMLKEIVASLSPHREDSFVFISSGGAIYGASQDSKDENSALNPGSFYAELKIRQEALLRELALNLEAKCLILRLANVYSGLTANPKGLIDSLLAISSGAKQLSISVALSSRKQYGLISDYGLNILRTIEDFATEGVPLRVQNIYSDYSYSVEEIVSLISSKQNIPRNKLVVIERNDKDLFIDTVKLTTIHKSRIRAFKWTKLESVLKTFQ